MILQTFALGCCLMMRSTDRLCKGSDDPVQMKYQMCDYYMLAQAIVKTTDLQNFPHEYYFYLFSPVIFGTF